MNPLTQSKNTTILPVLIALTLACFALSPQARAVCQEGCLTNQNTVLGDDALSSNTGVGNTAIGFEALLSNNTGNSNTAIGVSALQNSTSGGSNTAIGLEALWVNTTGGFNTAVGTTALQSNTIGESNAATGYGALVFNTTGTLNTANGEFALAHNTTGSLNIAVGAGAGQNLTTGNSNIDIGNDGRAGDSGSIRIGTRGAQTKTSIAGISGVTVANGVGVIINPQGQLGTVVSSERFKAETKPMDKASEAILALKPVTFRYKHELDPEGIPQFGLVAEQVEKVNPNLVARDEQGKPYTVRYEAVNAMLLNEFIKEHRTVESLVKAMTEQQKENAAMRAMLEEQAAQIQKVSAQLELNKPARKTALNNQ